MVSFKMVATEPVAAELMRRFSQPILTLVFCTPTVHLKMMKILYRSISTFPKIRKFRLRMIGMLLCCSLFLPPASFLSLRPLTYDWLFKLTSADCVCLRPPGATTDDGFPPVLSWSAMVMLSFLPIRLAQALPFSKYFFNG